MNHILVVMVKELLHILHYQIFAYIMYHHHYYQLTAQSVSKPTVYPTTQYTIKTEPTTNNIIIITIFANGFKILLLMFLLILFKFNRIQKNPLEDEFFSIFIIIFANGF